MQRLLQPATAAATWFFFAPEATTTHGLAKRLGMTGLLVCLCALPAIDLWPETPKPLPSIGFVPPPSDLIKANGSLYTTEELLLDPDLADRIFERCKLRELPEAACLNALAARRRAREDAR